jgi:chemotaxis-related protein WspB
MLFLLFQVDNARYALDARRVVEVLPLVELSSLANAPKGVAGMINYRGRPVPAVDLTELALGVPARERLSTRILLVKYPDAAGRDHLLGLIAEHATEILRTEAAAFVEAGVNIAAAPYLGPVLLDAKGPIHWLREQQLLAEPIRDLLFTQATLAET